MHPIDKLASLLDEEGFEYEKTLIEEIKIIVPGWEDSGSTCRFVAKKGMIEIKEASAFFPSDPDNELSGPFSVESIMQSLRFMRKQANLGNEEPQVNNFGEFAHD